LWLSKRRKRGSRIRRTVVASFAISAMLRKQTLAQCAGFSDATLLVHKQVMRIRGALLSRNGVITSVEDLTLDQMPLWRYFAQILTTLSNHRHLEV
jgi:hypothetical protein